MRVSLFVAALALCAVSVAANANPVNYSLTGNMTGTLNGTAFTDAAVTFTFLADTANTTSPIPGLYLNGIGIGTVTVAGLGTAGINGSTLGVESYGDGSQTSFGFFDGSDFNVGILDPSLPGHDLSAPFTDTSYFLNGVSGIAGPESTTLGDLIITGGDSQNQTTTFTASALSAVPEPSSFILLGTGLAGIIGAARRRIA